MKKAIFILALALTLTVLSVVQVSAATTETCRHEYEVVGTREGAPIEYSECITYIEIYNIFECIHCGYSYERYSHTETIIEHTYVTSPNDGKDYCYYCWRPAPWEL